MSLLDTPRDSVIVDRLTLRTRSDTAQSTQQRLIRELEWADWPDAPGESWVFIRKVKVTGPTRKLKQQVLDTTQQALQSRPDGENLVRFANLTELLAALLNDIALGRLQQHWYWQRFSHLFNLSPSGALLSVMREQADRLISVCARLAQQRHLSSVWQALTPADASLLLAELSHRHSISIPSDQQISQAVASIVQLLNEQLHERKKGGVEPIATSTTEHENIPPALLELPVSAGLKARWAPLMMQFAPEDSRFQLILLLLGLEIAPIWQRYIPAALYAYLQISLGQIQIENTVASINKPDNSKITPVYPSSVSNSGDLPQSTQSAVTTGEQNAFAEETPFTFTKDSNKQGLAGFSEHNSPSSAQIDTQSANSTDQGAALSQRLRLSSHVSDAAFGRFHTHQGGLLYLLNLLNLPPALQLMEQYWPDLPNGWLWLYRLGQELALDEQDALAQFIAQQLGYAKSSELTQLPPLPCRDPLIAIALQQYGRQKGNESPVWTPDLLKMEAQIHHSPTHIDLYAPMNAIRLPLRLVGLDLNPGWLPWLGRVVTFHYGI